MKVRKGIWSVMTVLLLMAIIGCASTGGKTDQSTSGQSTSRGNLNVPEWYENPPQDPDYIFGVGSAKMASTNRSQQAAEHRARNSLTFQLNSYVRAMEIDYGKEAGTTNNMAVVELFETIDRQLATAALRGANVVQRFVAPDGTHWALVSYPKDSAKAETRGIIENAASREAAIQAEAALKAMDTSYEELSRPQVVDTGDVD